MIGRAPVLAWILTALACFLAGALVGEGWSQTAPHPGFPTVGVVVTVEVAFPPPTLPEPTLTPAPVLTPWMPLDRLPMPACDPFGAEAPRCDRTADAR